MELKPLKERRLSTPKEEIAYLREQLKSREVLRDVPHAEHSAEAHTANKEVIAEYINDERRLEEAFREKQSEVLHEVLGLSPDTHDTVVEELISIAKEKGIQHTLKATRALANPHLEDDFHRMLVQYIKAHDDKNYPDTMGIRRNQRLWRALNLALFEVTVAKSDLEDEERDAFKSSHARMQELFSGLRSIVENKAFGRDTFYFTIEIALENVSSHVRFFLAIPKGKVELFEKQFSALFPTARLAFIKDDYNIFNEQGIVAGSFATLEHNDIYPIRFFDTFASDPLNTILNAFTKLSHEGEGAALQFLFSPKDDQKLKYFRSVRDRVKKGEKARDVLGEGSVSYELKKFVSYIFSQEKKPEEQHKPPQIDEDTIERINEKISTPLYSVNVRILASAPHEARAETIREGIEAGFNQFTLEGSNAFVFQAVKGAALVDLERKFSFRVFDAKTACTLNHKELATIIHIPGPGTHVLRSAGMSGRTAGAPPSDLPQKGLLLGVNTYRGQSKNIFLSDDDRLRHFYVIGQTGTGKSTLLKNMVTQDIIAGNGVCMIDPHGSDIEDILAVVPPERFQDVIYFDPSDQVRPMGLNMLEYDRTRPEQKTFVVNEMLSIFNKLFDMKVAGGPMFEQYFRNAVLLALENPEPATLLDVSRVLSDQTFRSKRLSESFNPVVVQFWNEIAIKAGGEANLQNIVPYITSKFDAFLSNDIMRPIIAQRESAFNFRNIMDERKILLVNLSKGRLGEINASLLGLIIVGKLLLAALSRVDSRGTNLPPFFLYLDEFQNITTDSIAVIFSEARKYKLSLTVAHQFMAQLSEPIKRAVLGNVGSFAIFRVGPEDAEELEKVYAPSFNPRDIMNIENRRALLKLLVYGIPRDPFVIDTVAPMKGNEEHAAQLKELSRLLYGRERTEIEREIMEQYRK
jgi:hypothetical protein